MDTVDQTGQPKKGGQKRCQIKQDDGTRCKGRPVNHGLCWEHAKASGLETGRPGRPSGLRRGR